MKQPFFNEETQTYDFPYSALRNIVFILPVKERSSFGSFIIPEEYRASHSDEMGIVVSCGPGAYHTKFKKFLPMSVKVGDLVIFDSAIPWSIEVVDKDGEKHVLKYCAERDIQGYIKPSKESGV